MSATDLVTEVLGGMPPRQLRRVAEESVLWFDHPEEPGEQDPASFLMDSYHPEQLLDYLDRWVGLPIRRRAPR